MNAVSVCKNAVAVPLTWHNLFFLSAHATIDETNLTSSGIVISEIKQRLQGRFGIQHITIQIECSTCE